MAARAKSPWFVQMFDVAFSRRMCCSRVESVRQKAVLPSASVVRPTRRPGICRFIASRQARNPTRGPPNEGGTPNEAASPAAMSIPKAPGPFRSARENISFTTPIAIAPFSCAASAAACQLSTTPRTFGDWTATAKVVSSTAAARAARSVAPPSPTGTSTIVKGKFARYVRRQRRYSGWIPFETTTFVRFLVRRSAMRTASTKAEAPSYIEAFATSSSVRRAMCVWNSQIAVSVPCETSGWYGVYAVRNSPRDRSCETKAGMWWE